MRSITVSSGKGGVGKTSFVINLAITLAEFNNRVLIFDADISLANIDVMLGISPAYDIRYVLNGEKTLKEIIYKTQYRFDFIPGSSGVIELTRLNSEQKLLLKAQMEEAFKDYDYLIFDNAAGISDNVLFFNVIAGERIVLCTTEPTSLADAYALIKVCFKKHRIKDFYLVVNMIRDKSEGKKVYQQLIYVLEKFLPEVKLSYLGGIEVDECVRKAIKVQKPYTEICPDSKAVRALKEIALKLEKYKTDQKVSMKDFLERVVKY